jgi:3-oxoacyl-[acyl-carrier protein] reductase
MASPITYRALVGGASQGIGRAVAEALAAQGCAITLLARDEARLREVAAALPPPPAGTAHDYLVADFSQPDQVARVVHDYLAQNAGGFQILVNNTGGPPGCPLLEAPAEAFRAAFEMHVIVNQLLTQAVVPGMRAAGYGRIINIISTSVKIPLPGLGVSNTIRGAVASWAKTLANELGGVITVNNVLPGATGPVALQHQAHGAGRPPRRVRNAGWQQEHVAGFNFNVHGLAILDDLNRHRALNLQKQLFALVHVVVFARIGPAHNHDDEVLIVLEHLLVAHGRLQQVAVLGYPDVQVEGVGHR